MNKANHSGLPRARGYAVGVLLIFTTLFAGCAHNNPRDPLEPFNRGVYAFNDAVDNMVLKPLATGYQAVLPPFVRTGVANFFSNLDDVTVILNGILQLKIVQALSDTGRFLINSTIGILGLFDVATHFGLEKHNEDFGQTLGYWGIGSGPYLVLPILGPSSFRDGIGRLVDSKTDIVWREDHIRTRNQFAGTRAISNRAHLLDSEKVIDTAAIDRYAFIRDAYLQRRRNLVHDGNPPPEPDDDEVSSKPRAENEVPIASNLVDQFGNVVAGPDASACPGQEAQHAQRRGSGRRTGTFDSTHTGFAGRDRRARRRQSRCANG
jgi:phospholipid-binding lipoprotein MlaA